MSEVVVHQMTERDATQLTEKIRITAHNYADARQKLQQYVAEAKAGNAHHALGYASWTAYLSEVLGEEPMRLARSERQEMVAMLSAEGMSTRAIAPIVGTTHKTIVKDLQAQAVPEVPPAAEVIGMDGKTYARPELSEPVKPKRRPLPDQASEAGWELVRAIERVQRIVNDDRFTTNKEAVAPHLRSHLTNAVEACQDLLDRINH